MLAVALTAKEFCCRPSELMEIRDGVTALAFDLAAMELLLEDRMEQARNNGEAPERLCL